MNTENNNNPNHENAQHDAGSLGAGLDGNAALPAELVGVAGRLDAMAAGYRSEMSGAAMVAMTRATRPSAGDVSRDGVPLKLVGETVAASRTPVGSAAKVRSGPGTGWSFRARAIGGVLAMAASVALVVAVWPASTGIKPGSDMVATTGGVDAAMQIASNVDDKLSLDEFDALLAEADAIGNMNLETDGSNAS